MTEPSPIGTVQIGLGEYVVKSALHTPNTPIKFTCTIRPANGNLLYRYIVQTYCNELIVLPTSTHIKYQDAFVSFLAHSHDQCAKLHYVSNHLSD